MTVRPLTLLPDQEIWRKQDAAAPKRPVLAEAPVLAKGGASHDAVCTRNDATARGGSVTVRVSPATR
jgi:hypothetical protein